VCGFGEGNTGSFNGFYANTCDTEILVRIQGGTTSKNQRYNVSVNVGSFTPGSPENPNVTQQNPEDTSTEVYCIGETVSLSASVSGCPTCTYRLESNETGASQTNSSADFDVTIFDDPSGVNVYLLFADGMCGAGTVPIATFPLLTAGAIFTSFPNPIVEICELAGNIPGTASTIPLNTNIAGVDGTWSGSPFLVNGNEFDIGASGAGTFPLVFTDVDCGEEANTSIEIIAASSVTGLPTLGPFCQSDPVVDLSTIDVGGVPGMWNGQGIITTNEFDPSVAQIGTNQIFFEPDDFQDPSQCIIAIIDIEVQAGGTADAGAGSDDQVCQNNGLIDLTTLLDGSQTAVGMFTITPSVPVDMNGIADFTGLATGNYSVVHEVSVSGGCGGGTPDMSDPFTIEVVAAPDAVPDVTELVCLEDQNRLDLSVYANGAFGDWTNTSTGAIVTNPSNVDVSGESPNTTLVFTFDQDPSTAACPDEAVLTINFEEESVFLIVDPVDVCPNEAGAYDLSTIENLNDPSDIIEWYDGDPMESGTLIASNTVVDLNTIDDLFALQVGGECADVVDVDVNFLDGPGFLDEFPDCAADGLSYNYSFSVNAGTTLVSPAGTLIGIDMYRIDNIPIGQDLTITLETTNGCMQDFTLQALVAAACCASIDVPILNTARQEVCDISDLIPFELDPNPTGEILRWLDENMVAIIELASFTPTTSGNYFVQRINPNASCMDSDLVPFEVILSAQDDASDFMMRPAFCADENIVVDNQPTVSGTYSFITNNTGATIDPATGSVQGVEGDNSYEIRFISDGTCPDTLDWQFDIAATPSFTSIDPPVCATDLMTYSVSFETVFDVAFPAIGVLQGTGPNYMITDIPLGTDITIELENNDGIVCTFPQLITALTSATCSCPAIAQPTVVEQTIRTCIGDDTDPRFEIQNPDAAFVYNWYDQASGGAPVQLNSNFFEPIMPGTYYVEALQDDGSGCFSQRTEISYFLDDVPMLPDGSFTCDLPSETYSVVIPDAGAGFSYTYTTTSNSQQVNQTGGMITISDIPFNEDLIVDIINIENNNCTNQRIYTGLNAMSNLCACVVSTPSVVSEIMVRICEDMDPTTIFEVGLNDPANEIVWYNDSALTDEVLRGSNQYSTAIPGTYYAVEEATCGQSTSVSFTLIIDELPVVTNIFNSCQLSTQTYSVHFTSSVDRIDIENVPNHVFDQSNAPDYVVSNIPFEEGMLLTFYNVENQNCFVEISPPILSAASTECSCTVPQNPGVLGEDFFEVCEDMDPTVTFETRFNDANSTTIWFSDVALTDTVQIGSSQFATSMPGDYYAIQVNDCGASNSSFFELRINDLPEINVIERICDQANGTYSVSFTSTSDQVSFTGAPTASLNASNAPNYIIENIPLGDDVNIAASVLGDPTCENSEPVPALTTVSSECGGACSVAAPMITSRNEIACPGDAPPLLIVDNLDGSLFAVNWYDVETGGTPLQSDMITFNPPGSGTYYAEIEDRNLAGCASPRTSIEITDLRNTTAAFTYPGPEFCVDNPPAAIADFPGGNYFITSNHTNGETIDAATGVIQNPVIGEIYEITYEIDRFKCPDIFARTSLTAVDVPNIETLEFRPSCMPDPISGMSIPTSYEVEFTTDGTPEVPSVGIFSASGNNYIVTDIPHGEDLVIVSENTAGCTDTLTIRGDFTEADCICGTSFENPTVESSGDLRVCSLTEIPDLSARLIDPFNDVLAGFNWYDSVDDGTVIFTGRNFTPTVADYNMTTDGIFYVEAFVLDDPQCTSELRTEVQIVLLQTPDASFTMPDICENEVSSEQPMVTTFGGSFSLINNPNPLVTINASTGIIREAQLGETYTVQYLIDGLCPDSTTVEVNVVPDPSFTITLASCINDNGEVELRFITDGMPEPPNVGLLSEDSGEFIISNIPVGTSELNFDIINTAGCITPVSIIPNPSPESCTDCSGLPTPVIDSIDPICEGDAFPTISSGIASTFEVTWYDVDIGGTSIFSGESFMPSDTGTYYIEVSDGIACTSAVRTPVMVSYIDGDGVMFAFDDFCNNDVDPGPRDFVPGGTFSIIDPAGDGAVIVPETGVLSNAICNQTYTIRYEVNAACFFSFDVPVFVNCSPEIIVDTPGSDRCDDVAGTYSFDFTSDGIVDAPTNAILIDNGNGAYTMTDIPLTEVATILVTNQNGDCSSSAVVTPPVCGPCNLLATPFLEVDPLLCGDKCASVTLNFLDDGPFEFSFELMNSIQTRSFLLTDVTNPFVIQICSRDNAFGLNADTIFVPQNQDFNFVPVSVSGDCDMTDLEFLQEEIMQEELPPKVIMDVLCAGETLVIGDTTFDENNPSGLATIPAAAGCDTLALVSLTIISSTDSIYTDVICPGDSIMIGGETFTSDSPSGNVVVINQGCPFINIDVRLDVLDIASGVVDTTICDGQFVVFNGGPIFGTGVYLDTLTALNGCDSIVTLDLEVINCSAVNSFLTQPNCPTDSTGAIVLRPLLPEQDFQYTWREINSGDLLSGDGVIPSGTEFAIIDMIPIGDYEVIVEDEMGEIVVNDTFNLTSMSMLDVDLEILEMVACEGQDQGIIRALVNGAFGDVTYEWNNGSSDRLLSDVPAGAYSVTVIDELECRFVAGTTLMEGVPFSFAAEAMDAFCPESLEGQVYIDSIVGGEGPFRLSVNGENATFNNMISDLPPGEYFVKLEDNNGCEAFDTVTINTMQNDRFIFVPDTVYLAPGTEYQIPAGISFIDSSSSFTINWFPSVRLSDPNVLQPVHIVEETIIYTMEVVDEFGCVYRSSIVIFVAPPPPFYFPNVITFDPTNVGNETFMPLTNENVIGEYDMLIFDRWGNQVFLGENLEIGAIETGWKGNFRGQQAEEDVYSYKVRIRVEGRDEVEQLGKFILLK